MNLIHLAGRLGADPEERFTPGGLKVISFRMAVNSRRKGEDITTWFRVTIFGDRFDRMLPFIKKGSALIVIGELQPPEIYKSRTGEPKVSLDVVADIIKFSPFGSPKKDEGVRMQGSVSDPVAPPTQEEKSYDDKLPF